MTVEEFASVLGWPAGMVVRKWTAMRLKTSPDWRGEPSVSQQDARRAYTAIRAEQVVPAQRSRPEPVWVDPELERQRRLAEHEARLARWTSHDYDRVIRRGRRLEGFLAPLRGLRNALRRAGNGSEVSGGSGRAEARRGVQ